jgi:hypothetical protein
VRLVLAGHGDVHAIGNERVRDGQADAPRTAGDERDLTAQGIPGHS